MKESILNNLDRLVERFEEVSALLADPDIIGDQNRFRDLSREYARNEPMVRVYERYRAIQSELLEAEELCADSDPDMQKMGADELNRLQSESETLAAELRLALIPRDPNDDANIFIEIRAGTGGDEAAIFAGDLFRMYSRYAENRQWRLEVISSNVGEHGGFREIISRIEGDGAYSLLKFESGAHRVQRVPETESQGRIHTSACTVAVLAEPAEVDDIEISNADLRIDTYRASGAGGQHVNKTDSAVRITHLPSGIVVECQDERSQHKNKARALSLLSARLLDNQVSAQQDEQAEKRKLLVGSGDRSERIRTYNYPQGRVTDHRINLTLYKLAEVIAGDLGQIIDPLTQEYQADQLAALEQ